jgi:hypothetical protein
MAKLNCDVEGCDREITEGTGSKGGLPICPRCRAAQYGMKGLNDKALAEKRQRWQYWEQRQDYLAPRIAAMLKDATKRVAVAKKKATG